MNEIQMDVSLGPLEIEHEASLNFPLPHGPLNFKFKNLIKDHVNQLFLCLWKDNEYHPLTLDQWLLDFHCSSHKDRTINWKTKYKSSQQGDFYHEEGGKRYMYKYTLEKINPPVLQLLGQITYRIAISAGFFYLTQDFISSIRIIFKIVTLQATVKFSHKVSLQSRAMSIILQNIKSLEQMIKIVDQTRNLYKFDTNKCKLCFFAPFIISPTNSFKWKLLMLTGSRAILPYVTHGNRYEIQHPPENE